MDETEDTRVERQAESTGNAAEGRTRSAGEMGTADATEATTGIGGQVEVVVGEIPDPEDLSRMLWTARCSDTDHGLLGTFALRAEAEECRIEHLVGDHGQREPE